MRGSDLLDIIILNACMFGGIRYLHGKYFFCSDVYRTLKYKVQLSSIPSPNILLIRSFAGRP